MTLRTVLHARPFQHRVDVGVATTPVAALFALRPLGACLLEGRGVHPENRTAYVPFGPRATLWGQGNTAHLETNASPPRALAGNPWTAITDELQRARTLGPTEPAFQGGWVGYLAHEAAAFILDTPVAQPLPPARPSLPWAHFRLYADVLAIDRATGRGQIIANDFGDEETPGPERLARAAALLRSPKPLPEAASATHPVVRTLDTRAFEERVRELQALVRDGDCFQANLTTSFAYPWSSRPTSESLIALYDAYAESNPGAWGAFYETPDASILSSSPECLADLRGPRLRLRPIAGTRPRGIDADADEANARGLRLDPKERAEHAMLVDLARNDAARICRSGTVHVPNLAGIERYRHVMHLVSEVEGEARAGLSIRDLLEAVFPGGTVTGAPKRRAVARIAEFEPGPRGPYTGALGYVSFNGSSQWNLLIRSLVATPTHLVAHAGCGIVEGSRPEAESAELLAKARAQVEAALGEATAAVESLECGRVDTGTAWTPARLSPVVGRRVLLVDHEDSFVHNLADYCERLGAASRVQSAHDDPAAAWRSRPTHLILSPGPGRPQDFPSTFEHIQRARNAGVPILGICLGHQALAECLGARVDRHPETVHGRATPVRVNPLGRADPVLGPWTGSVAGRYHSLVARDLPPAMDSLAELADGTCMAMRVRGRPEWGLQFHPESLLTEDGMGLLRAFLEVEPHA